MHRKHKLYPAFKRDLQSLMEQVGENRWLTALSESVKSDSYNWDAQQRIVDRINDTLNDNHLWQSIRTAYGLRGTWRTADRG